MSVSSDIINEYRLINILNMLILLFSSCLLSLLYMIFLIYQAMSCMINI